MNTYRVLGREIHDHLLGYGVRNESYVFSFTTHDLLPNEHAIKGVRSLIREHGVITVLTVGSGVIHDIVRYATFQESGSYISIPTAPPMAGHVIVATFTTRWNTWSFGE
jgi:glycerol-1-phosphate dehydrogenase [NAD(P)+]